MSFILFLVLFAVVCGLLDAKVRRSDSPIRKGVK